MKKRPTVGRSKNLLWVVFGVLEKSFTERAGGGFGERGADDSASLGCEGVKKRRSLEGKVYFYDKGYLGALPWNESAGGESGRVGRRNCILEGRSLLEPCPSEHKLQLK